MHTGMCTFPIHTLHHRKSDYLKNINISSALKSKDIYELPHVNLVTHILALLSTFSALLPSLLISLTSLKKVDHPPFFN